MDWMDRLSLAEEDARDKGRKEGRKEGLEEGIKASNLRFIRLLMEDGKTFEEACAFMRLTKKESEELHSQL